ncbi:MAG: 3-phosphoshikimate 1-carboxyvinyltransferase [Desulfobacula sp.]|uniref:3-phosphoshikimate 1-carboxyvinyltransferase n=1 Tax=Desulfobacula sp. TaxID=2593537 RepID=UPI0025BD2EB9|nr:3-phosphoshikimate 1-carboxyvinyltransferase [Desulfobacula sp.]MCD4723084.1 3-phosphoshikimate 1-carboxyvinyltransferase [Desulfobacula sp.]
MIEIRPEKIKNCEVSVPGSKSYTHRILIASALSDGICSIDNALKSEDTLITVSALQQMGIKIDADENRFIVHGTNGEFKHIKEPVFLDNSGTSMRLLTALASLGKGRYVFTGTKRMKERPIQDLLDALIQMGALAHSVNNNGCPPVAIKGGDLKGGKITINCETSSQYLSAILFIASFTKPFFKQGLEINVTKGPVSRPYIDMTVDVMERFGINVMRNRYNYFKVQQGQEYRAGSYFVEPDCSQAGYFWGAAAITGACIKVKGITRDSQQGDVHFTRLLEEMGCKVLHEKDGISVTGGSLSGIEADMADMPDMVPTLAVVSAFAKGTTVIKKVKHLKAKESDRLTSVANELSKMGIDANLTDTGLVIKGGIPHRAEISTYKDHRIAMSFAIAGIKVPGIFIKDEKCVEKSFPDFWNVFNGLHN